MCRDKRSKWSTDGTFYFNYSSWSPDWSAVCWYDLVLLRRASPLYAPLALRAAALPRTFCTRLESGWCDAAWLQRLLTTTNLPTYLPTYELTTALPSVAVLDTAVLTPAAP